MTNEVGLIDESDRSAVIVGAAILESDLEKILRPIFHANNVSQKHLTRMFDVNGPLSSFSSKILVCHGFGLISATVFSDLEAIRKLRNHCAHMADKFDFLSPDVQKSVFALHCTQDALKNSQLKRYSPALEAPIPEWEMRSRGFVKHAKAVFCIGVHTLKVELLKYAALRLRGEGK